MTTPENDPLFERLSRQADERLEEINASAPKEWGEEIELAIGERWFGRYLGDARHPVHERTVRLLFAPEARRCFMRDRTVLTSEFERVRPTMGDYIVIARGEDGNGPKGGYHIYAVVPAPCPDPLPEGSGGGASPDEIPFAPTVA